MVSLSCRHLLPAPYHDTFYLVSLDRELSLRYGPGGGCEPRLVCKIGVYAVAIMNRELSQGDGSGWPRSAVISKAPSDRDRYWPELQPSPCPDDCAQFS